MRKVTLIALIVCVLALGACGGGNGLNPIFDLPDGFNDQVQLTNQAASAIISEPEHPGSVAINDAATFNFRVWLLKRSDGDNFDVDEVTDVADYSIISGDTVVQLIGDGRILALAPGTAVIEAANEGNQCRLTVIVN